MQRRSKKSIALMLAIMMLATLFIYVPAASAAIVNYNIVGAITVGSNVGLTTLGQIVFTEDDDFREVSFAAGTPVTFNVTIKTSGVTFAGNNAYGDLYQVLNAGTGLDPNNGGAAGGTAAVYTPGTGNSDRTYSFTVVPGTDSNNPRGLNGLVLNFPVEVQGASSGSVEVEVICDQIQEISRTYTIGSVISSGTNTTSLADDEIAQIDQNANNANNMGINQLGLIRIQESTPNSVVARWNGALAGADRAVETTVIRIDLPSGVSWNEGLTRVEGDNILQLAGTPAGDTRDPITFTTNSAGHSRLEIRVAHNGNFGNPNPTTRGIITIDPFVDLDDTVPLGDIYASVTGNRSGVSSQSFKIGVAGEYGNTVELVGDPTVITAGALDQAIGDFIIKESSAGSMLANRTISIELPSYVRWFTDPVVDRVKGNGEITTVADRTNDNARHIKRFTVENPSTNATEFKFERGRVFVDADAPEGDVVARFYGNAGVEAEVVVATIVKPVTAEGGSNNVIIGYPNQEVSDLVITEGIKSAIHGNPTIIDEFDQDGINTLANAAGQLVIDAPNGVTFAKLPTVTVTEGDIRLDSDTARLAGNDNQLVIRVRSASNTASTITVSDIELTLDRTVPEGALNLGITGTGLDRTSEDGLINVQTAQVATVVTPAPTDEKVVAVFGIDSTNYVVNEQEFTMDVAPYINTDNRTMMPVRYVGLALGVLTDNINWNDETRTAVLIKGSTYVQLQAGSNILKVNGVEIQMDTAPEIIEGRMMIPLRFVAQAFGATVNWDEDARTATFTL